MVIWLVILAIMILIEAVTMGLTTVWFALGALGAAVVTGFGGGFWLQFTVFVILSFLSMIVFRPIADEFCCRVCGVAAARGQYETRAVRLFYQWLCEQAAQRTDL